MASLGEEQRAWLLRAARASLEAAVGGNPPPLLPPAPPDLEGQAGVFVSLHRRGELRGCVGYVEPRWPLAETVCRAGQAVARDGRFDPLRVAELPELDVEVSVLSSPAPIRAEDVEVGRHGLLIVCGGRSGLLLPQVAIEHGWDLVTFLDQLCVKAGLRPGTWRSEHAALFAFTAERFSERGG